MDKSEWLARTSPEKMLGFLRGRASERKLWLFACARAAAILTGTSHREKRHRFPLGLYDEIDLRL